MPGEAPPKVTTRWEGTHTYKKPEAAKKRARTVAQLREEAAAKSKANREEAINKRRGSIGCASAGPGAEVRAQGASVSRLTSSGLGHNRRGSTGGILTQESASEARVDADPSEVDVVDLAEGEEDIMPGSAKKKRNPSGPKQGGEEEAGDGVDPALIRFLTAMKNDIMDTTRESVGRLETRLERTEGSIAALEQRVERGEKDLPVRIAAEVAKQMTGSGDNDGGGGPSGLRLNKREAAFHFCRRSLKLWPVEGEDIQDAVRRFLATKLGLSDARIRALGSIEVSPLPGKAARERKEILATFETREDRDSVKANGINLAGHRGVGMALHVPGHLMDNLVALNGLGYSIKLKNPGTKRTVKFDDARQDLFLDICIGGSWKRISPEEAKQVMKEVPNTSGSQSITIADLTSLVKGDKSAGEVSAVVLPEDGMET